MDFEHEFIVNDELQKIIDFLGEDVFYGINDDNILFENYEKDNLEKDLYPKE